MKIKYVFNNPEFCNFLISAKDSDVDVGQKNHNFENQKFFVIYESDYQDSIARNRIASFRIANFSTRKKF